MPVATTMMNIQEWITQNSRDILDECDALLATRTQLIYPSGQQTTVDGHPHRWETIEEVLKLVERLSWSLQKKFPNSIELVRRPSGGFHLIYFLRKDAEDALLCDITDTILRNDTSLIETRDLTHIQQRAIKIFLTSGPVNLFTIQRIDELSKNSLVTKKNLLLLRGLLVHRILLMALKKRWNVHYGLHPGRDPMAVPYNAKGVPSDQAEWGHPDVAILFTCLSFCLQGLSSAQLKKSLEHLAKTDDSVGEYERWTQDATKLNGSLRNWNSINVDDETQLQGLLQHLAHNVVVVNYFLNHFVFPRHAKQFQVKLQASGWDIPLLLARDEKGNMIKRALTTGFSGTNDSRSILPLTIKQEDLKGLLHTNAEVLTYLLQDRNRQYVVVSDKSGKRPSESDILRELYHRHIRMLIDAGAQILEVDNISLVKSWLKIDTTAKAALFFDADNKATIIYRNHKQVPLLASPFAEDLTDCLVYLDEAHTRGTDLKMPLHAKGALTLSLGQTKDHTVQGE